MREPDKKQLQSAEPEPQPCETFMTGPFRTMIRYNMLIQHHPGLDLTTTSYHHGDENLSFIYEQLEHSMQLFYTEPAIQLTLSNKICSAH